MVEFGIEFVPRDLYWKTTFCAVQVEKIGCDYLWITNQMVAGSPIGPNMRKSINMIATDISAFQE